MPSCCVPEARLPDRSPSDGTEAGWGAAGVLLLIVVPGRGCRGPAGPPQRPRGGLGHATRRAPASGGTSQPAKSPQSKGAGSRCQISCPYALRASSQALQHRLGIQPFPSRLPHQQEVFCQERWLSAPQWGVMPSPRWGEGLLCPSVVSRELPGCTTRLRAPVCFGVK